VSRLSGTERTRTLVYSGLWRADVSLSARCGEFLGGRKVITHQGPCISPSTIPQALRSSDTGSPFSIATERARNPSDDEPSNRTVGSGKLCPVPPSQDSKVSIPFASNVITISLIPSSSGGSNTLSLARLRFSGSGLSGVLPGQCSHLPLLFVSFTALIVVSNCCPVRITLVLRWYLCQVNSRETYNDKHS
jgi:hypothetical protein